mmetsp:Transcript_24704/g.79891  ORF Transcript_24704/g.79891 Transcript_24704/m.79891 type:complete len:127 (-) Transcript_24704:93-473(-)
MRHDPVKSRKPDPPLEHGQQGRNTGAKSTIFQRMIESNLPDNIRNQDPREALLKYADEPPIFRTDATHYRDARGDPVFNDTTLDEAEKDFIEQQKNLLRLPTGGGGAAAKSRGGSNAKNNNKRQRT